MIRSIFWCALRRRPSETDRHRARSNETKQLLLGLGLGLGLGLCLGLGLGLPLLGGLMRHVRRAHPCSHPVEQ